MKTIAFATAVMLHRHLTSSYIQMSVSFYISYIL